jgi:hypothetical protein
MPLHSSSRKVDKIDVSRCSLKKVISKKGNARRLLQKSFWRRRHFVTEIATVKAVIICSKA